MGRKKRVGDSLTLGLCSAKRVRSGWLFICSTHYSATLPQIGRFRFRGKEKKTFLPFFTFHWMLRWAGIDNGSRPLSCWWWLTSWGGCSFDEFLAFSWGSSLFWGHDLSSSHRNTLTCGHGRRRCVFNPWRCDTIERIFFFFCFVEWWADTFNTRSFGLILVRSGQKKLASLLQYFGYVVTPLFMLSVLPFLFHFTYSFQQHVNYPWENEHWNGAPSTSTKTTSPNELRAIFYSTTLTITSSVDPCLYANQQYTHCALCWGNSRFFCFSKPRTFTRKSDPFSHETLHFTRPFRTIFHQKKKSKNFSPLEHFISPIHESISTGNNRKNSLPRASYVKTSRRRRSRGVATRVFHDFPTRARRPNDFTPTRPGPVLKLY